MQTIHLEGNPTLTVICLFTRSSWAAKAGGKNIKTFRCKIYLRYISPPDHHGQRSSQAETEVQGLCLHRQEHQFCIKRGEKTILTEDEKSNN